MNQQMLLSGVKDLNRHGLGAPVLRIIILMMMPAIAGFSPGYPIYLQYFLGPDRIAGRDL